MKPKKHDRPDYIDEQQEWQRNQFNPGHYTGGKIPPLFKNPGKPKFLAIIFGGLALVYLIGFFLSTITLVSIIIFGVLFSLYALACIRLLRKK